MLTSLKALSHHVDPSQLPTALEGPFPYCHGEWVQFFQVSIITAFSPHPHPFSFSTLCPVPWTHLNLSGSKTVIQQTLIMRVQSGVKKSSGSGARRPGSHPQLCCVTWARAYNSQVSWLIEPPMGTWLSRAVTTSYSLLNNHPWLPIASQRNTSIAFKGLH